MSKLLTLSLLLAILSILGCVDPDPGYRSSSSTTVKASTDTKALTTTGAKKSPINTIEALVVRVVDGDTIQITLNGKKEKVRLIGVDTPETKHPSKPVEAYGKQAEEYTRSKLSGRTVFLELDVQERDKYGRVLAYVWLTQPSKISDSEIRAKMFNAHLLLDGYAQLATYPPNVKYVDHFTKYQVEARNADRGLWGVPTTQKSVAPPSDTGSGEITVYLTRTGEKYHVGTCGYLSKGKIPVSLSDAKAQGYEPCSVCGPPQ
ncbi:MAG: thermonuclease family protein [Actinobacteria bacterium]|nr:thermonuclease family protein [Actinomycetota bacterium]